jgi:multidrug efflux pump subunit AcrA (membrane-fusion protein)
MRIIPFGSEFRPRGMRVVATRLAAALIVLTTLGAGVAAQDGGVPVTTTRADRAPVINTVRLSGSVVTPRTSEVSTSVGGLVQAVEVDLGTRVARGDVLVRLDRDLAEHAVARADASVAEARAELDDAKREVRVGERLAERGNLPQNELDAREARVAMRQAALERLKAEAAREREQLRRRIITAPFAGVIARKATEAGEWVSPGTTVADLVATDELRVDIPVPQKYYPQLRDGAPVTLEFDALPEQTFDARRIALVPVSDPTARATVRLDTGTRGIVIARDAVIRYPDGRTTVWRVRSGDDGATTVTERQVQLGRTFDGRVHVRSGLEPGARVVVRGNESLREGQRVTVTDGAS